MALQFSNSRSLVYNSATNIANFSGSVVVASNLGINVSIPSYTLVVGGDMYSSGSILAPNVVYQFLQGTGTNPIRTYTAVNQVFGRNYNSGATGYLTPYETVGVTNTVGSGWVDGNWYAPKTGKYLVDVSLYINSVSTANNRWMLYVYDASNNFKYFQFVVHDRITQSSYSILTNYSTILNMNSGDYFTISLYNYAGNTDLYYSGTQYTSMKITQIA